jgi:hypothetical protein
VTTSQDNTWPSTRTSWWPLTPRPVALSECCTPGIPVRAFPAADVPGALALLGLAIVVVRAILRTRLAAYRLSRHLNDHGSSDGGRSAPGARLDQRRYWLSIVLAMESMSAATPSCSSASRTALRCS